MRRLLPPLNAIKAFECAGRHQSLSGAADELGVTHGAISRQIKILEGWLGVRLFAKDGRGVALTMEGANFLKEASAAFNNLAIASEHCIRPTGRKLVRVNAPQTFTMRWLIPRLAAFNETYPQIEVRSSTSILPIEKVAEHFDVAIRRGSVAGGSSSLPFLSETCLPVLSPRLLQKMPVATVADLKQHIFLHAESLAHLWPQWLEHIGQAELRGKGELRFEPLYHSLQAALDGVGVAMGPSALVAEDVAKGRLVPLFPTKAIPLDDFQVFTWTEQGLPPHVKRFRDWLMAEGAKNSSSHDL